MVEADIDVPTPLFSPPISVFPWLGTLCRIMTLLVTVGTGEMTHVLESRTGYVGQR